ncbi:MAG: DUF3618 domain-containing protein [Acidimicrobiales bacterium]
MPMDQEGNDMERSAEELRTEIDNVRGDLGETLEAIGDRVAPKKVVARAKADLTERVDEVKEKVSPARLTRRGADALRRGMSTAVGGDGNASSVPPRGTRGLAGQASVRASSAADSLGQSPQAARNKIQGNPVAAGLLVAAGGFFLAALLPPSDTERELIDKARERLEPLTSDVVEASKSAAEELRSSAQQSLEKVKDTASSAAQEVKGQATSSVSNVKDEAADAGNTVAEQTKASSNRVKKQAKNSALAAKDGAEASRPIAQGRSTRRAAPRRPVDNLARESLPV